MTMIVTAMKKYYTQNPKFSIKFESPSSSPPKRSTLRNLRPLMIYMSIRMWTVSSAKIIPRFPILLAISRSYCCKWDFGSFIFFNSDYTLPSVLKSPTAHASILHEPLTQCEPASMTGDGRILA